MPEPRDRDARGRPRASRPDSRRTRNSYPSASPAETRPRSDRPTTHRASRPPPPLASPGDTAQSTSPTESAPLEMSDGPTPPPSTGATASGRTHGCDARSPRAHRIRPPQQTPAGPDTRDTDGDPTRDRTAESPRRPRPSGCEPESPQASQATASPQTSETSRELPAPSRRRSHTPHRPPPRQGQHHSRPPCQGEREACA